MSVVCPVCQIAGLLVSLPTIAPATACPRCGQRYQYTDGVWVLATDAPTSSHSHLSAPLTSLQSSFARLSFYQLIKTVDEIRDDPPTDALMVGCGTGREFGYAATLGCRITGIDVSFEALRAAAQAQRDLRLDGLIVYFEGGALPFEDGTFDLVIAHHALHHIDDPMPMLREMWRVSRRRVIVHEPAATAARRAIVRVGLRPRIEEDGATVRDLRIQDLREFARLQGASLKANLCLYPKPTREGPSRWHRAVDSLHLTDALLRSVDALDATLGPIAGTKVTAVFDRGPALARRTTIEAP